MNINESIARNHTYLMSINNVVDVAAGRVIKKDVITIFYTNSLDAESINKLKNNLPESIDGFEVIAEEQIKIG